MKKKKTKLIITLLGLPGSGKGTQGKLLAKELGFDYVSTGALVRRACFYNKKKVDEFCKKVRSRVEKGIPQPNAVIKKLILDHIGKLKIHKGLILDSYPLSMGQLRDLSSIINKVEVEHYALFLKVSQRIILDRLSKRKICPKDDIIYNVKSPFYRKGICKCGSKLVRRDDDRPDVVRKRILEYKDRIKQLIDYFKRSRRLIIVDASNDIKIVHQEALNKIKKLGIL